MKQIQWSKQPLVFHNLPELFHKHDFIAGVCHIVHHRKLFLDDTSKRSSSLRTRGRKGAERSPPFSSEKFGA